MPSSINALYKELFAGSKLQLRVANKKEYESIRTALCKEHAIPKLLLETTSLALCANYDGNEGVGTFWLGEPRRRKRHIEVLSITPIESTSDEAEQLRTDLGSTEESTERSKSVDRSESSQRGDDADHHQHGAEHQEPSASDAEGLGVASIWQAGD